MKTVLPALALSWLLAPALFAQKYEISPFFSYIRPGGRGLGSLQENALDNHTHLKMGPALGVRATWNFREYYGFELGYSRAREVFQSRVRPDGASADVTKRADIFLHQGFFDFLAYMMPRNERIRPFLAGGMQLQQYGEPKLAEFNTSGTRNYGGHYGGGIKLKLVDHVQVRLDFRDYIGGIPYDLKRQDDKNTGGLLHQLEASVGVGITF